MSVNLGSVYGQGVVSQARRNALARRLVRAREEIGWKRRELARISGWCGESNLRDMELGNVPVPLVFLDWLERLARFHRDNPCPDRQARGQSEAI